MQVLWDNRPITCLNQLKIVFLYNRELRSSFPHGIWLPVDFYMLSDLIKDKHPHEGQKR